MRHDGIHDFFGGLVRRVDHEIEMGGIEIIDTIVFEVAL